MQIVIRKALVSLCRDLLTGFSSARRSDSTDHESIQFFAALPPATIRAAVVQTWRFTSVEED
jgi:hypothetical protein